jgi:hypothetical protein
MENIREIEIENADNIIVKHIVIEHPDGSITTMRKEVYEVMQAKQFTPIVSGDAIEPPTEQTQEGAE